MTPPRACTRCEQTLAPLFGLEPERIRVIAPHVGGGFGSKGTAHAHNVLAGLAAQTVAGRAVKLALTRQQMFSLAGYRTPTIQRIRLGADRDGRLTALAHDVVEQTSTDQGVRRADRGGHADHVRGAEPAHHASAGGARRAGAVLDARTRRDARDVRRRGRRWTSWRSPAASIRSSFGSATSRPSTRNPASPGPSRNLVDCLREGARRFGWARRDPTPGARRRDGWLIGTGVAELDLSRLRACRARRRRSRMARTALRGAGSARPTSAPARGPRSTQIAADALGLPGRGNPARDRRHRLPTASVEGGSSGISIAGDRRSSRPRGRSATSTAAIPARALKSAPRCRENPDAERFAMHSFGAQFAEVRVHADTGEIRVPRMLGVFSAGRIINPRTARSQLIGGMTMGLSMALHEESVHRPALRPRRQPRLRRLPHRRQRRRDRRRG